MKSIKVIVPIVALAGAVLLGVTACAPGGGSAPVTSKDGTSGSVPHNYKGEITYWGWQSTDLMPAEIKAFNKVYPNIKVNYELKVDPSNTQSLALGLQSSSGPDLFFLPPGSSVAKFSQYTRDLTGLAQDELGSGWKTKVSPLATSLFSDKGKLVAAATGSQTYGTWLVNKSILDKLGLDVPSSSMTMDQLTSFCKKVIAGGYQCLSLGGQAQTLTTGVFQEIAESIKPGVYEKAVAGTAKWTDPSLVKALTVYESLFTSNVLQAGAVAAAPYPDLWTQFMQQKAAMTVLGTWTLGNYTKDGLTTQLKANGRTESDSFVNVLIPQPDLGLGNTPQLATSPASGDAINLKSKNLKAAEAYISWKDFSKAGQQFVANALLFQPSLLGVTPQGLDFVDPSVQKDSINGIFKAASTTTISSLVPCASVASAIGNALQQAGVGQSADSVAAGLETASAAVDRTTCS